MTKTSQKIIFFGTEDFSAISLQRLIADGHTVVAVVTKPDTRKGRGQQLVEPKVKSIAKAHNIDVWQPVSLDEIVEPIKALQPVTGALVSFGRIIPQRIIDLFEPAIINVHPSLLPKYRGPSPIETAILNGDEATGVSLMQLSAKMDAGPVYMQTSFMLDDEGDAPESKERLTFRLGHIGAGLLSNNLPAIISGELVPIPQRDNNATYCRLITKEDGVIDWSKPAVRLEREVRAYAGWPGSRATLGSVDSIITDAWASDIPLKPGTLMIENDKLYVGTSAGSLRIDALKPVGKKEMPVQAFLAGYKDKIL